MTADGRGARIQFGGSPWSRQALQREPERAAELAERAQQVRANVSVTGKSERGPWVVSVWNSRRGLRFAGSDLHATIAFGLERWEAGATDTGIRWTAGPDHLAHGSPAVGRSQWTLCKRLAVPEALGHPEHARCQACWLALDRRIAVRGAA